VRIAVPDGHAQRHTAVALEAAGIRFEGYGEGSASARPHSEIEGLEVKLIRPQDMPQQVALGQFDLAITGRDWLWDHKARFPSSPVVEVADLARSKYQLAAAVTEDLPAETIGDALRYWRSQGIRTIRVASEYVNIADEYSREHQFGHYQVIPITGASEGFVPEDAEVLVEGTETGSSFRANRIRAIDTLMMSTNCVIARKDPPDGPRGRLVRELVERFRGVATAAD
jgi:ATP phosphoribosyltransferase